MHVACLGIVVKFVASPPKTALNAQKVVRVIIYLQHLASTLNTFGSSITTKISPTKIHAKTIRSSFAALWSFCLSLASMIWGTVCVGTAGTP